MRRREFITLLIGTAAGWPHPGQAQQPAPMRRVGILSGFSETEMQPLLTAFRNRLSTLGWVGGQNLLLDVRLSKADYNRMKDDAGALVSLKPDVILAQGTPGVVAVRQHSRTLPVVFLLVADPAQMGFIDSLARPGGYTTGFTNFQFTMGGKWLDLLRQIDPNLTHVTLISNPNAGPFSQFIESAGQSLAIGITVASVNNSAEIEMAITEAARRPGGGLIVIPDSLTTVNRDTIIDLASRHRLPAVYPFRIFTANGGLMSYGLDFPELYRDAANYVDRILKGEKPADLPVQAPTQFQLVINLKTAKTLGLSVPMALQASADEVIE